MASITTSDRLMRADIPKLKKSCVRKEWDDEANGTPRKHACQKGAVELFFALDPHKEGGDGAVGDSSEPEVPVPASVSREDKNENIALTLPLRAFHVTR
jgi:hypothetical protein